MKNRATDFQKKGTDDINVLRVKDVTKYLGKSQSWVYANYELLGGVKVGGSLFFPSKEKIYERLFRREKKLVEVRVSLPEEKVHEIGLQNKKSCNGRRGRKKKGGKNSQKTSANRHGLLDFS